MYRLDVALADRAYSLVECQGDCCGYVLGRPMRQVGTAGNQHLSTVPAMHVNISC